MNSDSVREALKKAGKRPADLARHMSISRQQLSNKLHDDTWNINDIARVAILTGGELGIVYPDGNTIRFTDDSIIVEQIRTLKKEHQKQKSIQAYLPKQKPDPIENEKAITISIETVANEIDNTVVEKSIDSSVKRQHCKKTSNQKQHNTQKPSMKSEQLSFFQDGESLFNNYK
ncbi:hypothetical protein [Aristaeella lactis]|uniref:hypothetical protein n=1 Tax=Aristaeella lactis TaxID=3046383 RepID=UPI000A046213|nr:hypothetical protein [Aristaeella lactis]QUA54673.1 hypothetical protein JYE50_15580 [Aristaeella lactis]